MLASKRRMVRAGAAGLPSPPDAVHVQPAMTRYTGRFAPSPTGALHEGSLVAALASWLDARAHGGRWLVRIEDADTPRCVPGAAETILGQLAACGLSPDEPPLRQSARGALYGRALERLLADGKAYPCGCSRSDVARAAASSAGPERGRHAERVYPGTCRPERGGLAGRPQRSVRLRVADGTRIVWTDRRLGRGEQDVARDVGDFVLLRADGVWAYQLAVVTDDAAQGVTDVVRGADLADNTPRQIHLQHALGLPTPRYLHTPLVRGADGMKLSKQNGARPLDLRDPLAALAAAGRMLGIEPRSAVVLSDWLAAAVVQWSRSWGRSADAPGAGVSCVRIRES
jgi:glutamyl-Q tRNA(Asp) synthetase